MATPFFDLPRTRARRPARRESVRVLHVVTGHEPADAADLAAAIEQAGAGRVLVDRIVGLGRALDRLRERPATLVLLQARHLDVARVALGELRMAQPAVPVILLTATSGHDAAVSAVRAGAEDCLGLDEATGPSIVRSVMCALERTSHAAVLRSQAVTDALTGLPNRHALQQAIDHALAMARRKARALAVLFVDLDGFKDVNDVYGHDAGDRVLQELAHRFAARTRAMDTVARIGGDEFVVVMEDLDDGRVAATVATKLLAAAAAPIEVDGRSVKVTASVGIAVVPGDGADAPTLLRHADTAMYAAKAAGKNQFRYYRAQMNEHLRARTALGQALDGAVERREFALHFQPVWDGARPAIVGCEALLRWRRPGHGVLLPAAFLDAAEEARLAGPLAAFAIDEAAAMAVRMRAAGFAVPVSVNLSRRQLLEGDVAAVLRRALEGLEASALQVEVSESVIADDDPRVLGTLGAIAALGVGLVVDEVGRGVSPLRTLGRLRPRALKIDGALARTLPEAPDTVAMARAIAALAGEFGATLVGAGVETEAEARSLRAAGCDALQGFFYGHALPADEWVAYLRWACTAVVGTDRPRGPHLAVARDDADAAPSGMPSDLPRLPGPALPRRGRVVVGTFRS
ncbi:MAG: EAL domain-containing protein [Vicinamibacterales bacterium]